MAAPVEIRFKLAPETSNVGVDVNGHFRKIQDEQTKIAKTGAIQREKVHSDSGRKITLNQGATNAVLEKTMRDHAAKVVQLEGKKTRDIVKEQSALLSQKTAIINKIAQLEIDGGNKSIANALRVEKKKLDIITRANADELRKRPDVQKQGAGVGVGILGTGRQLISQSGLPGGALLMKGGGIAAGALAAGALAKEAIGAFQEYETAAADFQAITGLTKKRTEDFINESLRPLSNHFGVLLPEAIEASKLVISAFGPAIAQDEAALKSMTNSVLMFAKASRVDAATSADLLNTSVASFIPITASAAEKALFMARAANVMAAASQQGNVEAGRLGQELKDVGQLASSLGLSIEDTATAIEVLGQAGVKQEKIGVGYRSVLLGMTTGGKEATDVLKTMGLTFADTDVSANGQTKALQNLSDGLAKLSTQEEKASALSKLFGEANVGAALALIEGSKRMNEFKGAISDTDVAVKQAEIQMGTTTEKWKRFSTEVNNSLGRLGEFAMKAVLAVDDVGNAINTAMYRAQSAMADLFTSSETIKARNRAEMDAREAVAVKKGLAIAAGFEAKYAQQDAESAKQREAAAKNAAARAEQLKNEANAKAARSSSAAKKKTFESERTELTENLDAELKILQLKADAGIINQQAADEAKFELREKYWEKLFDIDARYGKLDQAKKDVEAKKGNFFAKSEPLPSLDLSKLTGADDFIAGNEKVQEQVTEDQKKNFGIRKEAYEKSLNDQKDATMEYVNVLKSAFQNLFQSIASTFLTPMREGLVEGMGVFGNFVADILEGLTQIGINALIRAGETALSTAITVGIVTAAMATIQAAAAPAAMLAAIASFGGAAIAGAAGVGAAMIAATALGTPKGFAKGGKVPGRDRGRDEVPAMLRPEEYVLTPEVARKIGYDELDRMHGRRGRRPDKKKDGTLLFKTGGVVDTAAHYGEHIAVDKAFELVGHYVPKIAETFGAKLAIAMPAAASTAFVSSGVLKSVLGVATGAVGGAIIGNMIMPDGLGKGSMRPERTSDQKASDRADTALFIAIEAKKEEAAQIKARIEEQKNAALDKTITASYKDFYAGAGAYAKRVNKKEDSKDIPEIPSAELIDQGYGKIEIIKEKFDKKALETDKTTKGSLIQLEKEFQEEKKSLITIGAKEVEAVVGVLGNALTNLGKGITDAVLKPITNSLRETGGLLGSFVADVLDGLAQIAIQALTNMATAALTGVLTSTIVNATMASIIPAASTAATLTSIATLGGGAAIGGGAVIAALGTVKAAAAVPGLAEGGKVVGVGTDTSDSNLYALSKDEHIIKAKQARKYRPLLDAINEDTFTGFASGGRIGGFQTNNGLGMSSVISQLSAQISLLRNPVVMPIDTRGIGLSGSQISRRRVRSVAK